MGSQLVVLPYYVPTASRISLFYSRTFLSTHYSFRLVLQVGGQLTWSGSVFMHVRNMKASHLAQRGAALLDTSRSAEYLPPLEVRVCGSFGSSFTRCFEMRHRWHADGTLMGTDVPRHDIVVLFGGGSGLPSALSALREFVRRRLCGEPIPRYVWFVWQCRHVEELAVCWRSLHQIICDAKGLCDREECTYSCGDRTLAGAPNLGTVRCNTAP